MGKKIKAIIVDDEPGCLSNLAYFLSKYCPEIEVVGTGTCASDIKSLACGDFDIAFLDIEIYKDNVFDVLACTEHVNFDIVFVTAYRQYALRSFEFDVLDYLLKPLDQKDIENCYKKILRRFADAYHKPAGETVAEDSVPHRRIILRQSDQVYIVSCSDIVFLEAKGIYTYVCFQYKDKRMSVVVSKPLSQLEALYGCEGFYRVHRSYLVNTGKISHIIKQGTLEVEMCTGDVVPVAKRRAGDFLLGVQI